SRCSFLTSSARTLSFFSSPSPAPRSLPSFPTRRSSDLYLSRRVGLAGHGVQQAAGYRQPIVIGDAAEFVETFHAHQGVICGDRQQGKVVETGKFAIGRRAENGTHRQVIVGHKLLGALLRSDLFAAMTAPDLVAETFTEQTRKSQCIIFFAADKLVIKRDAPGL